MGLLGFTLQGAHLVLQRLDTILGIVVLDLLLSLQLADLFLILFEVLGGSTPLLPVHEVAVSVLLCPSLLD